MSDEQQGSTRREFVAVTAGVAAAATFGFNRMSGAEDLISPVTQLVTLTLKPGAEEKAVAALKELTAAVKEKEPGVLCYVAHRSQKDPSKVVFFEVYKDAEAAANHTKQPHMAKMFTASKEFLEPGMDIQKMFRVAGYTRES